MSVEHTIVVKFEDGAELPAYSATTQFMGGRVVAVNFHGNRLEVADELLEALEQSLRLIELISPFEGDVTRKARAAIAKAGGAA